MTPIARCLALTVFLALGCGPGSGGGASTDAVRSTVREHIRASGDAMPFTLPGGEAPVSLGFDHVHEGVHDTTGGRQVVCVDFTGADGTLYDVDFYVDREGEAEDAPLVVEDAVLHKVSGESVLSEERKTALDRAG